MYYERKLEFIVGYDGAVNISLISFRSLLLPSFTDKLHAIKLIIRCRSITFHESVFVYCMYTEVSGGMAPIVQL